MFKSTLIFLVVGVSVNGQSYLSNNRFKVPVPAQNAVIAPVQQAPNNRVEGNQFGLSHAPFPVIQSVPFNEGAGGGFQQQQQPGFQQQPQGVQQNQPGFQQNQLGFQQNQPGFQSQPQGNQQQPGFQQNGFGTFNRPNFGSGFRQHGRQF